MEVDLIQIRMADFDVILGMDWLSRNFAKIDCRTKRVEFQHPELGDFQYQGGTGKPLKRRIPMVSAMKAWK